MREVQRHSRGERAADAVVHAVGFTAALAACAALAAAAPRPPGARLAVALGLYGVGLLAMLGCSALYNLAATGSRKALLRRLDHAAIFMMIAGTYTPVALLAVGGASGWALLAVVWTGAAGGVALKLLAPRRFGTRSCSPRPRATTRSSSTSPQPLADAAFAGWSRHLAACSVLEDACTGSRVSWQRTQASR
jgi:predicted membrane channel-forming protein YqfA (hemolysin III family)